MATVTFLNICAFISFINCLTISVTAQLAANNVATCASVCESTFLGHEQSMCIRGCRLMSLIGFIHGSMMNMEELREACLKTCGEAYTSTNASACAFGCQSELPVVEECRNKLMQFAMNVDEHPLLDMTQRFMDYSNRIMNGLMSGLNNGATRFGWVSVTSYSSSDGANVVVVVDSSPQIQVQSLPERQTSFDKEINFDAKDLREPELEKSASSSEDNSEVYGQTDLFGYLSAKTHLSRLSVTLIFVTLLMTLLWFVVGLCFPSSHRRHHSESNQKLSIYGDLEYLPVYDDSLAAFMKDKKFHDYEAPPLPLKTERI